MKMLNTFLVATMVWSTGCASQQVRQKAPTSPDKRPSSPPAPFVVGSPAGVAPWLQNRCGEENPCPHPASIGRVATFNRHVGVFKTAKGELFAARRGGQVMGPLYSPPGLAKVEVFYDGRLLVTDGQGALWTAKSFEAAMQSTGWSMVPGASSVKTLSAAGQTVAFIDDQHRAFTATWPTDATKPPRWKPVPPTRKRLATDVVARADGLVVVRSRAKKPTRNSELVTHILRAGAKRWTPSNYEPRRITDLRGAVGHYGRCNEFLAADGKRWLRFKDGVPGPSPYSARYRWGHVFQSFGPTGFEAGADASHFEQPSFQADQHPDRVVRGRSKCARPMGVLSGLIGGSIGGLLDSYRCKGVLCLKGSTGNSPPRTSRTVSFVGDGVCHKQSPADSRCRAGARFTRNPQVVFYSRKTGDPQLSALPAGCTPVFIQNAAGMGILTCRDTQGRTRVFTNSARVGKQWRFEGLVEGFKGQSPAMSGDGTLLFQHDCPRPPSRWGGLGLGGGIGVGAGLGRKGRVPKTERPNPAKPPVSPPSKCSAWVRSPVPVGTADAWRYIQRAGAVAYRPGLGGSALAIELRGDARQSMTLVQIGTDGKSSAVTVATLPVVRSLSVDPDGSVVLTHRPAAKKARFIRQRVFTDASLKPAAKGDGP